MTLRTRYLLLLLAVLGLVVRLYGITSPLADKHAFRQTQTAGLIREYQQNGIDLLHPSLIVLGDPGHLVLEFPLYQAFVALLQRVVSPDMILARLLSISLGLCSALFVYRLARKTLDERSAAYAAGIYLFFPLNIFYQRVPLPDNLAILLSLMMLDFLLEGLRGRRLFLTTGTLIGCLAFICKPPIAGPLLLPYIYAAYQKAGWSCFRSVRLLVSLALPAATLILWQMHANQVNNLALSHSPYPYEQILAGVNVTIGSPNPWIFGSLEQRLDPLAYWALVRRVVGEILAVGMIPLLVAGVLATSRSRAKRFYFVWSLAVVATTFVAFNVHVIHNYYLLYYTPVLAIFCGAGIASLAGRLGSRRGVGALMIIGYGVTAFLVLQNMFELEASDLELVERGRFVKNVTDPDSLIAIGVPPRIHSVLDPRLMYHSERRGFLVPHAELDAGRVAYLGQQKIRYLVLTDYSGGSVFIDDRVRRAQPVASEGGVRVYRLEDWLGD